MAHRLYCAWVCELVKLSITFCCHKQWSFAYLGMVQFLRVGRMGSSKDIFPSQILWYQQLSIMFFFTSCAHNHLTTLLVKHIDQFQEATRAGSQTVWLTMQWHLSPFFMRTCVSRIPNIINYIFSNVIYCNSPMESIPVARNKALYHQSVYIMLLWSQQYSQKISYAVRKQFLFGSSSLANHGG
jgi:hypothetical protein